MKTYLSCLILGASLLAISISPELSVAQTSSQSRQSPLTALEQVITSRRLESQWFSANMLRTISLPQLQEFANELKAKIREELGDYQSIQFMQNDKYRVIYERGSVIATIQLDRDGRIAAIGFDNPEKF